MKSYIIEGLKIYIFNKDKTGYKLVTTSNGYRGHYGTDWTNKEIISKLKEELFK